jgi:hypothetical protein
MPNNDMNNEKPPLAPPVCPEDCCLVNRSLVSTVYRRFNLSPNLNISNPSLTVIIINTTELSYGFVLIRSRRRS